MVLFIFVFDGGGWQRLAMGVGLQRKCWVFREKERHRFEERETREKET